MKGIIFSPFLSCSWLYSSFTFGKQACIAFSVLLPAKGLLRLFVSVLIIGMQSFFFFSASCKKVNTNKFVGIAFCLLLLAKGTVFLMILSAVLQFHILKASENITEISLPRKKNYPVYCKQILGVVFFGDRDLICIR